MSKKLNKQELQLVANHSCPYCNQDFCNHTFMYESPNQQNVYKLELVVELHPEELEIPVADLYSIHLLQITFR